MQTLHQQIAVELKATEKQVDAAVGLLDEGATVPFIARYRKEVTGGLDDTQLRLLEIRLNYLRELEERRQLVLDKIDEAGKLDATLKTAILEAQTKIRLEDLYRPYIKKRRSKALIAREAGLQALAETLLKNPDQNPETSAAAYLNPAKDILSIEQALAGASDILIEMFSEDATLVATLREQAWQEAQLQAHVIKNKEKEGAKFSDYFDFSEALSSVPSHRALALFRGQKKNILRLSTVYPDSPIKKDATPAPSQPELTIRQHFKIKDQGRAADPWLLAVSQKAWKLKLSIHLDLEMKHRIRESAEAEAIRVFARNLRDLLLAAPAGQKVTMGLDPGIRTGVKVAVTDNTGKLIDTSTIYPHPPKKDWKGSIATLTALCKKHTVQLVSIGNGTASRETDRLVAELIQQSPKLNLQKMMVSEAGASVYSASAFASQEFPDLDVSLRGAVSIARRLQDPLAELVKIEGKAIGVGQYQHDVNQIQLSQSLDHVVEDCVNAVGVDLNTASAPLLSFVSGLSTTLAHNIIAFRDQNGPYRNRKTLMKVPRLGPKAFEQCAGFLRVTNGEQVLDTSAVHPEAYGLVEKIAAKCGRSLEKLIGDSRFLRGLEASDYVDRQFGEPTICDILAELEKPGRDPRPEFKMVQFRTGIEKISDLKLEMTLEGVVSNVTNFGAFVDIGVHQDGLVHISQLADRFVSDPHKIVKAGDIVKVRITAVDLERKRIGLTMRADKTEQPEKKRPIATKKPLTPAAAKINKKHPKKTSHQKRAAAPSLPQNPPLQSAMAAALEKARREKDG